MLYSQKAFQVITQRRMLEILEKGRVDDRQSLYCDLFLSILIVVNLIAVCLETIDSLFAQYKTIFVAVELISVSIFSIEYVLRIWSRPAAQMNMVKTPLANGLAIFSALLALLICWLFCQAFCRYCLAVLICAGFVFCG